LAVNFSWMLSTFFHRLSKKKKIEGLFCTLFVVTGLYSLHIQKIGVSKQLIIILINDTLICSNVTENVIYIIA